MPASLAPGGPAAAGDRGLFRYAYAVLGFAVYSAAGTMVLRNLNGDPPALAGDSEITSAVAQVLLLLGIVPALLPYRHRLARDFADLTLYFLIVALCLLSAAWSPFPWPTLRRSVTLGVCVLFGVWCYLSLGLAGTLKIYARTTLALCVLSVLAFLALPAVGREVATGYENAMRGVYSHKNTLGESAVLAVTCCFYELFAGSRRPVVLWLAILFLAGCELLARTGTSLLVTMMVILAGSGFLLRPRPRARIVAAVAAGLLVLTVVVAFAADPDAVFDLFGRDASLTGRVPLWIHSFHAAMARPLLGYGYNGFWVADSMYVAWLWAMLGGWKAPSSHNGYLDIVLQIGLVGRDSTSPSGCG